MLRRRRESGFTLIETTIVLGTVTLSTLGVITAHLTCARLAQTNRETQLASQAVRSKMEEVAASDVTQVVGLYDSLPANDPGGAGTGPGATFAVGGLAPNSLGATGDVVLPLDGAGHLREDITDPALGMPRDLNGDGVIDALDHSADFCILPVLVRVRWNGLARDREMRLHTVLYR